MIGMKHFEKDPDCIDQGCDQCGAFNGERDEGLINRKRLFRLISKKSGVPLHVVSKVMASAGDVFIEQLALAEKDMSIDMRPFPGFKFRSRYVGPHIAQGGGFAKNKIVRGKLWIKVDIAYRLLRKVNELWFARHGLKYTDNVEVYGDSIIEMDETDIFENDEVEEDFNDESD